MSTPSPAERSSSRTITIVVSVVAGIVLLIVLVCGGLGYVLIKNLAPFVTQMVNDMQVAQGVGQAFAGDISNGKLENAYARTSASYQHGTSIKQFQDLVAKHPALTNGSPSIINFQLVNNTVVMQVTFNGPKGSTQCTVHMIKENDEWKVDRFTIP